MRPAVGAKRQHAAKEHGGCQIERQTKPGPCSGHTGVVHESVVEEVQDAMATGPDVGVVARARCRHFSSADKRRILAAADHCTKPGEIGALMRREREVCDEELSGIRLPDIWEAP